MPSPTPSGRPPDEDDVGQNEPKYAYTELNPPHYVVMALGLNIVVGFAGLLDLGYVAFFAIGAYTAAYFASGFWDNAGDGHGVAILVGGPAADCRASMSTSCWSSSLPWRRRRWRAR